MLVKEIVDQALDSVGYSDKLIRGLVWFNNALRDAAKKGTWKGYEGSSTYQTEAGVDSVLFSASKWPDAALTTYSKEMKVLSNAGPFNKIREIDHETMLTMQASGVTGYPEYFSINGLAMHFFPQPAAGFLPLLTQIFQSKPVLATSLNDDIEDTLLIPDRYQQGLIPGVQWQLMDEINDQRASEFLERWNGELGTAAVDNQKVGLP